MRTSKFLTALFIFLGSSAYLQAQSVDEIVKDWERAKAYTKEYLDAMPESGYSLKPTPEMRSFAEQMLHLTDTDYAFIAAATGEKPAVKDLAKEQRQTNQKQMLPKLTLDGYDFVINSIKKLTGSDLLNPNQIVWSF